MYQETIDFLKHLEHRPTVKEYDKLAKEKNLLTRISLRRLSGICDFYKLYKYIKNN